LTAATYAFALLVVMATAALAACGGTGTTTASPAPSMLGAGTSGGAGGQHGFVWKFETRAAVRSSPAVADGVVYVGSDDGYLYAVDSGTGRERWRFKTGKAVYSSAAVAKGLVYVGSTDGHLYAVDGATGKQRWKFKPVPVLGCDSRTLWRPSPAEVRRLPGEAIYSSPVVSGRLVYVNSAQNALHALDSATGRWRWSYETGTGGSAAVSAGVVYQGYCALAATSGKKVWAFDANGEPGGPVDAPVIADGFAYYCWMSGWADEASLVATGSKSGHLRWRFSTRGHVKDGMTVWFSPGFADGVVYFAGHDGRLYALDGKTGKEHWDFKPDLPVSSSPTVSGGIVYFGSYDGCLYAVR
jgi:outer membrane protein assembly factor BamB